MQETRINVPTGKCLHDALSQTMSAFQDRLGPNDRGFLLRIFRNGLTDYIDRLNAIGFSRHARVLDAGCGFGQWSLALAQLNDAVSACDISKLRVDFLAETSALLKVANLTSSIAPLDALPYPDNHFDAVFCYGVIFLTPWRKSLVELVRVLKPDGKLYVNANGVGWYLHLWHSQHNKTDDYDPRAIAARSFSDTLRYERQEQFEAGMNLIIEPDILRQAENWCQVRWQHQAGEGRLHTVPAMPAPKPFFQAEYHGANGVYELLGVKRSSDPFGMLRAKRQ
jgi:SAM-dependent methyltransferase